MQLNVNDLQPLHWWMLMHRSNHTNAENMQLLLLALRELDDPLARAREVQLFIALGRIQEATSAVSVLTGNLPEALRLNLMVKAGQAQAVVEIADSRLAGGTDPLDWEARMRVEHAIALAWEQLGNERCAAETLRAALSIAKQLGCQGAIQTFALKLSSLQPTTESDPRRCILSALSHAEQQGSFNLRRHAALQLVAHDLSTGEAVFAEELLTRFSDDAELSTFVQAIFEPCKGHEIPAVFATHPVGLALKAVHLVHEAMRLRAEGRRKPACRKWREILNLTVPVQAHPYPLAILRLTRAYAAALLGNRQQTYTEVVALLAMPNQQTSQRLKVYTSALLLELTTLGLPYWGQGQAVESAQSIQQILDELPAHQARSWSRNLALVFPATSVAMTSREGISEEYAAIVKRSVYVLGEGRTEKLDETLREALSSNVLMCVATRKRLERHRKQLGLRSVAFRSDVLTLSHLTLPAS